jgi:cell division protease FtsH
LNDLAKNLILWAVIAVILLSVFSNFSKPTAPVQPLPYSTFIEMVKSSQIQEVTINGRDIQGKLVSGASFSTYDPETSNARCRAAAVVAVPCPLVKAKHVCWVKIRST